MKKSKLNQVGNFEKLVSFTNAQGLVYNPSKASIKVAALQALLTQVQGSVQAADVSRIAYENALNARQQVFRTVPKHARRIVAALKASGASRDVIDDCVTLYRRYRYQGRKPVVPSPDAANAVVGKENEEAFCRKLSHLDLDSQIANFNRLVLRVGAELLYKPNEVEFQIPALTAFVITLREKNKSVINTYIVLKDANQLVNKLLHDNSGIYGHATAVKSYIEFLYGYGSVKHREVTSLSFTQG